MSGGLYRAPSSRLHRGPVILRQNIWNKDLKTDPVALALFDEKGTDWCSNSPGAPRGARMLPFVKMKKQAVPARFADFVEVEVLNGGANEHVWVNFDKALRCGIDKILDNGGTAMDDDARAWTAIINSYERAWPDCGASAMSDPLADFENDGMSVATTRFTLTHREHPRGACIVKPT